MCIGVGGGAGGSAGEEGQLIVAAVVVPLTVKKKTPSEEEKKQQKEGQERDQGHQWIKKGWPCHNMFPQLAECSSSALYRLSDN